MFQQCHTSKNKLWFLNLKKLNKTEITKFKRIKHSFHLNLGKKFHREIISRFNSRFLIIAKLWEIVSFRFFTVIVTQFDFTIWWRYFWPAESQPTFHWIFHLNFNLMTYWIKIIDFAKSAFAKFEWDRLLISLQHHFEIIFTDFQNSQLVKVC